MMSISRLGLLAVMVVSSCACLTETADAKWIPIFKCRTKCADEAEPAPEPCPAPEPAPACCPAPEPAPEPAPACCAAPEPAPACCTPVPEPAPVSCAEPEPVAEVGPCCCGTAATEAPVAAAPETAPASGISAQIEQFGMPELAEGETLVSISPVEVPTEEEAATLTVAPKE